MPFFLKGNTVGTSNFMFNYRLDVVTDLTASQFDVEAYNEGLDEEDCLQADDHERIGEIIGFYTDDFISDFKYRADEPRRNCSTQNRYRKHRIDGFYIETTTDAVEDRGTYYDRNYGGTKLAEITAETVFFGERICMKMDVVMRHGYYDGVNIDQQINLETGFSGYSWDDYNSDNVDGAVDYIINEYVDCHITGKAAISRYRKGIAKRFSVLEQALWQRYKELLAPYCERYRVTARFSNGETWYERATS